MEPEILRTLTKNALNEECLVDRLGEPEQLGNGLLVAFDADKQLLS